MIVTNKGISWELKDSSTLLVSALWIIPFPIHFFPIAFIVRGMQARVRSWIILGILLAIVDGLLFVGFGINSDKGLTPDKTFEDLFLGALIACYILGMVILALQTVPYLNRKYLVKTEGVEWVNFLPKKKVLDQNSSGLSNSEIFIGKLLRLRSNIENASIQANIDRMVSLFTIIQKKDTASAEKFLIVHATVVNVLTQYDDLENAKLDNAVAIQSKKQLESVIEKATIAFEQELTNRFKTEIMEVSAETDAYLQQLKNKNLIE